MNFKKSKCKCMICGKAGILYNDFDGYNFIPVKVAVTKKTYLICRECFEYLENKAKDRKEGEINE